MNAHITISEIMTKNPICVTPSQLMTDVAEIFDLHNIHHIPVVSERNIPIGIISRHDYCLLQHHFTRSRWDLADAHNHKLFSSLAVKEVMSENLVKLKETESTIKALRLFLKNKFHSIVIIKDDGECSGILTPFDIMKEELKMANVLF